MAQPHRSGKRPGPPGKGRRRQITVRIPSVHYEHYERTARMVGMPLGDYLVLTLSDAVGLHPPPYLRRRSDEEMLPL